MILQSLSHLAADLPEKRSKSDVMAWRFGEAITFEQFQTDVRRVASAYSTCTAAALVCVDSYHFLVGFFGLLHAKSKIIIPPGNQPFQIEPLKDKFSVLLDDAAVSSAHSKKDQASLEPLNPVLPAIDIFTSGSTGTPKKVTKNLDMFDKELAVLEQVLGKGLSLTHSKVLATVSHQHVYGLTFKLLWSAAARRAFTTETHAVWESLLPEITQNSIIISSPAHLTRLSGIEKRPASMQPKLIISAGAPLPFEASCDVKAILGCAPLEIFGSTETGAIAQRVHQNEKGPWRFLPGVSATCDEEGRMSVSSPFTGPGWQDTSDLVDLREDGFFHRGRADRIVKIEGKRVSLVAVEEALQSHPYIKNAAVVPVGDPLRLAAAIITSAFGKTELLKQGNFQFRHSIKKDIMSKLDTISIPRFWRFIDELPNNTMGKRRDADIKALFRKHFMNLPFSKVKKQTDDTIVLHLDLSHDLIAFQGHFPGHPILPGVVQVDWVMKFGTQHFTLNESFAQGIKIKFSKIITPEMPLTLTIQIDRIKEKLLFTYHSGNDLMSSGQISLGKIG